MVSELKNENKWSWLVRHVFVLAHGHQNLQIAKLARNVGQKRQHQKVNTLNMQMEVEVKQNIFPITRGEKL